MPPLTLLKQATGCRFIHSFCCCAWCKRPFLLVDGNQLIQHSLTSWGNGSWFIPSFTRLFMYTSQVVVWDFWTINSMTPKPKQCILKGKYPKVPWVCLVSSLQYWSHLMTPNWLKTHRIRSFLTQNACKVWTFFALFTVGLTKMCVCFLKFIKCWKILEPTRIRTTTRRAPRTNENVNYFSIRKKWNDKTLHGHVDKIRSQGTILTPKQFHPAW